MTAEACEHRDRHGYEVSTICLPNGTRAATSHQGLAQSMARAALAQWENQR